MSRRIGVSMLLAPRARVYITLAALLLLSGCSAQVEGFAGQLSDVLGERCGWVQDPGSPFGPALVCQVTTVEAGGGLWRVGDDPCDVAPASALRVEPGQLYAEWERVGARPVTDVAPCDGK